ncbi:MAG: efflux RND transporter periplasmic adaptor subunit [Chloroflexi bacterium]|nr:efflux RND transporter periplasmic adaptor subunit [Chloroflexota bacterium]
MSTLRKPFFSRFTKRTWWIIAIVALLLVSAGGYAYYKLVYTASATTAAAAPLQTSVVRQGNLIIYASGNGTLVAASEASFSFGTSGQVAKVNAKVGDLVKAGDVLAELDNSTQQIQYIQAKRALADLTSPYAIATAELAVATNLKSAETARGSLGFLISPVVANWEEQVAKAEQGLADAQAAALKSPSADADANVKKAESLLKYYQDKLVGSQFYYTTVYVPKYFTKFDRASGTKNVYPPSDSDIASARATLAQAKASVVEAKDYLAALRGEPVPDDAGGSNLTALENAKLDLKSAEDTLAGTQLIAPISGTLMTFDVTVGNKIDTSTTVTIADLSQPYIQVYLDPADWKNVKAGNSAEITFDSLPDLKFNGKVTQVDPGLYTSSNTSVIRALVQLDPSDAFDLPLGSTAAVDVIGGRADNALLVPIEALHAAGEQYTVFVMKNGKPTLRVVEVGIQDQVSAEIKSGLQVGDIVTTGIAGTNTQ